MVDFAPIVEAATARCGGTDALCARLPAVKSAGELRAVPDDRYLSAMALRIFRAGLKHSMVDAKWPAFEEVFFGFDPRRVEAMSDEALEALLRDARLIRHWPKLKAVRANAAILVDVAAAHGGFGAWLAAWPLADTVGLWADLDKRFAQMGGQSGPAFLRMVGRDTFILTEAVVRALHHWTTLRGQPKSRRERAAVQQQFNAWHTETGRPLAHLSMILALSVE